MGYLELSWIAFIFSSAVQIVITYTYFSSIFDMRYSRKTTLWACIILTTFNLFLAFTNNAIINIAVSLFTFTILIQFFVGKLLNRLIFSVFFIIAGVISEFIIGYVLVNLSNISPNDVKFGTPEFVYGLVLSRTQLAIFAKIISRTAKNRKLPSLKVIHWVSLIVPSIGGLVTLYNFMYVRAHSSLDMISSIIVMVTCIIVITTYDKILSDYEVELKNSYLEELLKYYKYQYYLAEMSERLVSKTKHDIKNLLIGFQTGIKNHNISSVQNGISQLLGEIESFDGPAASGNLVIDSIINYKASIASKMHIYFSMDLKIPQELNLNSIVVCQILGSALDNAIEATEKIENQSDKIISISASYKHEALFLNITNPYKDDIIADSKGNLMSSKREYRAEGIGLQSIKSIISESKADFSIDYKDNIFGLSVTLFGVDSKSS